MIQVVGMILFFLWFFGVFFSYTVAGFIRMLLTVAVLAMIIKVSRTGTD